ncbi:MAG: hypothetical protein ACI4QB_00935, partial [Eubacteriales bacterium]
MLYRTNMPPRCATCARATRLGEHDMLCRRYGVVYDEYKCKRYVYDPLKRIPPRTPPIPAG